MSDTSIKNIYLTDENVDGDAIDYARRRYRLEIIRDVDIEVPCDHRDYDLCLFYYAIEHGYVLVTGNKKHFERRFYQYIADHDDHPGIVLILENHQRSSELIGDWLALWLDQDIRNMPCYLPPS
jgi:hypothetical protein